MARTEFKIDFREFNRTFRSYRDLHARRTAPDLVNKKALFIARGAVRETSRPEPTTIGRALSKIIYTFNNSRKKLSTRRLFGSSGQISNSFAPIAALIINFRRGKQGKKGLHGIEMADAIKHLIARANSSRAFLASGWIPAIKKLTPLVHSRSGMPPDDNLAKKVRHPYGNAIPATSKTFFTVAKIINDNLSRFTTTNRSEVSNKAAKGLQKAIDKETASMKQNIEDEMRKAAHYVGIKTN